MSWNYRVVKFKGQDEEPDYYEIREVYYHRDGTLMGHCEATVAGDSLPEIIRVLDMMKQDAHRSVIREEEFHARATDDN